VRFCCSWSSHIFRLGLPSLQASLPHWASWSLKKECGICSGSYQYYKCYKTVNFNDFLSTVLPQLLVDMHINYLSLDVPVVCGKIFFTECVINLWNSLPPTVSFTSLSSVQQTICNVDFSSFVSCH